MGGHRAGSAFFGVRFGQASLARLEKDTTSCKFSEKAY